VVRGMIFIRRPTRIIGEERTVIKGIPVIISWSEEVVEGQRMWRPKRKESFMTHICRTRDLNLKHPLFFFKPGYGHTCSRRITTFDTSYSTIFILCSRKCKGYALQHSACLTVFIHAVSRRWSIHVVLVDHRRLMTDITLVHTTQEDSCCEWQRYQLVLQRVHGTNEKMTNEKMCSRGATIHHSSARCRMNEVAYL
jgi:hypothetical protein